MPCLWGSLHLSCPHWHCENVTAGSSFVGRQQGNAVLNLLISLVRQEEEEGAQRPTPALPAAQETGLWACQGQECSIHISALSGKQQRDEFPMSQKC